MERVDNFKRSGWTTSTGERMKDFAAAMLDDEKAIKDPKCECVYREEVHCRNNLAVVVKKSRPEFACLIGRMHSTKIARHGTF